MTPKELEKEVRDLGLLTRVLSAVVLLLMFYGCSDLRKMRSMEERLKTLEQSTSKP